MKIEVLRVSRGDTSTEGEMYINGVFQCYTLEDKDRGLEHGGIKHYGNTAIPCGEYKVTLSMSNRFKEIMPEILDVPQFTGIRIHKGNTSKDTDGCILVGMTNTSLVDDFIGSSAVAYNKLLPKLQAALSKGETITIKIM